MQIRDFDHSTDHDGLRRCVVAIQDYERTLDPRLPKGLDIVDRYVPDLFQRCHNYHGRILVADVEGEVAGFTLILCRVTSESIDDGDTEFGLVGELVVLEEFRGRGYGAALLSAAEAHARASGVIWLRIAVLDTNHVARELYLAKGFRPQLVQMEKSLIESGGSGESGE